MPRDPAGTYSYPPGIEGIPDQTIESADYNSFLLDVQQDLNTPRPIVAGGTGAANPHDAMVALSGEITDQKIDNYDSFPFMAGSFFSAGTATGMPVAGHDFAGICYLKDNDIVLEARDLEDAAVPGRKYVRQKLGGTWGAWQQDGFATEQEVDNYDTFPFVAGTFSSTGGAISEPVAGHDFAGICYIKDDAITVEARDLTDTSPTTPGVKYVRQKIAGSWTAWAQDGFAFVISDTPPVGAADNSFWYDLDSASMFVLINDGDSTQWVQWGKV